MRAPLALAACLLAALLGGCAGDAGGADGGEEAPAAGTLEGVVVDDAIRPVAGARVELDGAANATTDADGLFSFAGVAPGAHVVRAARNGYADAVAQVVLSPTEPVPLVKLVLLADASALAYAELQSIEGFVECGMHTGTHSFAACGTANVGSFILCAQTEVCLGNLTGDRYITIQWFDRQPSFLVSEVAWEPTQALAERLRIMLGSATVEQLRFFPETPSVHNQSTGPSPVYVTMNGTMLAESGIGVDSWFLAQTFAAPSLPAPGLVLEQRFTMYLASFYGYAPPPGWRFTVDGVLPPPPRL